MYVRACTGFQSRVRVRKTPTQVQHGSDFSSKKGYVKLGGWRVCIARYRHSIHIIHADNGRDALNQISLAREQVAEILANTSGGVYVWRRCPGITMKLLKQTHVSALVKL